MPQMAPLLWFYLFVFFIFSLILFINMNFYMKLYTKSSFSSLSSEELMKTWKF